MYDSIEDAKGMALQNSRKNGQWDNSHYKTRSGNISECRRIQADARTGRIRANFDTSQDWFVPVDASPCYGWIKYAINVHSDHLPSL